MFQKIFGIDPRALGLFRIGLAILILCDLFNRALHLEIFYTDQGVLPRFAYLKEFADPQHWSIHLFSGQTPFIAALFLIHAVLAIGLLLGYRTWWCQFLCWLLLASLHGRNPIVLQGGDILLRCLLFFSLFLPLGERFSIDQARSIGPPRTRVILSIGSFALLMQTVSVYIFTAILKWHPIWIEGKAVYLALNLEIFTTAFGQYLRDMPSIHTPLTYLTLAWEFIGPVLVFSPFLFTPIRLFCVLCFVLMHLSFAVSMELGLFPYISIVSWIPFLPPGFFDFFSRYTKSAESTTVFYDGNCGFCRKGVYMIHSLFCPLSLTIKKAQDDPEIYEIMERENSWVVQNSKGIFTHFHAFLELSRVSPILFLPSKVLGLAPFHALCDKIYKTVASNRMSFSLLTRPFQFDVERKKSSTQAQILCLICLLYMTAWNIRTIDFQKYEVYFPKSANWFGNVFRIDQYWSMFAPFPLRDDGYFVMPARLTDGTEFDLWTMSSPVNYEKPKLVSATFENQRWRKYMVNLWKKKNSRYRLYLGKYYCLSWSKNHPGEAPLESFQIYFVKEYTPEPGEKILSKKVRIWRHNCFK